MLLIDFCVEAPIRCLNQHYNIKQSEQPFLRLIQQNHHQLSPFKLIKQQSIVLVASGLSPHICHMQSTMTFHYSETQIVRIIDHILKPQNDTTLRMALTQLQQLENCNNFVQQFFSLALRSNLNADQKLLALTTIQKHLKHKHISIDMNLINIIFGIFNSSKVDQRYKNTLVHMMCTCESFMMVRDQIARLILYRQKNCQMTNGELYIIYIGQYILSSHQNWSDQVSFIFQINHIFEGFARSFLTSFVDRNNNEETLVDIIRLFKIIANKLQSVTYEQQLLYINSQITDLLHDILRIPLERLSYKIKCECFELLNSIFSMTCEYLQYQFEQMKSILYIPRTISELLFFFPQMDKIVAASQWISCMQSCTRLILNIYQQSNLYPGLILPDREIIIHLIKAISLKKLHYDSYYFNPIDFISFMHQIFVPQIQKSVHKQKQDGDNDEFNDAMRRFDASLSKFITRKIPKREELYQKTNGYHYITILIETICQRNELLMINLLEQIIEVLNYGYKIEGFERTSCLILIGILKKQILKRPQIMNQIELFLLNQLSHSSIPTIYTEQPQNIHFFIIIALSLTYLMDFFQENKQNQLLLFQTLSKVLNNGKRPETSLVLLCIETLEYMACNSQCTINIINIIRSRISKGDNYLIINQLMSTYLTMIQQVLCIDNAEIHNVFNSGMIEICSFLLKWKETQKLYSTCFKAIQLLFEYKSYLQVNFERNVWNRQLYNQLIILFATIQTQLKSSSKEKEKSLIISFNKYFIQTFNLVLQTSKYSHFQATEMMMLIFVLDYYIQQRQSQLQKGLKKMLELLLDKNELLDQQITKRIPTLLFIFLLDQQSKMPTQSIVLAESYLIVHFSKFDSDQIIMNFCNSIERAAFCQQNSSNTTIQACKLIVRIILQLRSQVWDQQLMTKIIQGYLFLNSNAWTNQVFIYILSYLLDKMISDNYLQYFRQIFFIVITLLDSNIKQIFQCISIEDQQQNQSQQKLQKLPIDEWNAFKGIIVRLKQVGLWQHLKSDICPKHEQVLRKSFLYENIDKRSRMVYRVK